jgi:hypothetical protein
MDFSTRFSTCAMAAFLGFGAPAPAATVVPEQSAATLRDGAHDFDFNSGTWHTRIRRILDPFSGGTRTMDLNGTVTVQGVWGGRAWLEQIEADGPKGHWEGLTLFLYNPTSHQWSQSYINSKIAALESPLVGAFKDGRGELFSQDNFEGRSVLARGVWSDITTDAHRFEISFSNDGGQTWHAVFIANLTKVLQ